MGLIDQLEDERRAETEHEEFTHSRTDRVAYLFDRDGGGFDPETHDFAIEDLAIRDKADLDMPLFYMTSRDTVKEARKVVTQFENPYMDYCTSLEELALSPQLYEMTSTRLPTHREPGETEHDGLAEDYLEDHHFRTLIEYEYAKEKLDATESELEEVREEYEERGDGITGIHERVADALRITDYKARIEELETRKERLATFVEDVETFEDEYSMDTDEFGEA